MDAQALQPTDEQLTILAAVRDSIDNLQIRALAGTGKTTTLELIEAAAEERPILCLAFNKKIAEEMATRFGASSTTVRTFNSLGHRIWAKAYAGNLKLDPKKTNALFKEIISKYTKPRQTEAWDAFWEISTAVARAKNLGYVPDGVFPQAKRLLTREEFHNALEEEPTNFVADLIDQTLTASIKAAYQGFIDFNDQIYMPTLFGGTFPRFPLILVDETQDLSPCNHAMLDKLVRGRLISVGDPWQSIYGFRGAKQGGMQRQRSQFDMTELDLSVSFRCPQRVVESVRWHVPHFKWTKPGGTVLALAGMNTVAIEDGAAILCRNNAPLFRLAFQLLSARRSVSVAGSEIGPKIVGIMRRLCDAETARPALLSAIEIWRAEKLAKSSTSANDIADCMKVFADFGQTAGEAVNYAEHLFKQSGSIRLVTGHKAKGLEWDTVYHLDPWLIGDGEQEKNLQYVISTRAKQKLYTIDSRGIK